MDLEDITMPKIMCVAVAIVIGFMFIHKYSIIKEESESFRKLHSKLVVCEAIGQGRCTLEALTESERQALRTKRNEERQRGYYK